MKQKKPNLTNKNNMMIVLPYGPKKTVKILIFIEGLSIFGTVGKS